MSACACACKSVHVSLKTVRSVCLLPCLSISNCRQTHSHGPLHDSSEEKSNRGSCSWRLCILRQQSHQELPVCQQHMAPPVTLRMQTTSQCTQPSLVQTPYCAHTVTLGAHVKSSQQILAPESGRDGGVLYKVVYRS